jgi:hypothetical protein
MAVKHVKVDKVGKNEMVVFPTFREKAIDCLAAFHITPGWMGFRDTGSRVDVGYLADTNHVDFICGEPIQDCLRRLHRKIVTVPSAFVLSACSEKRPCNDTPDPFSIGDDTAGFADLVETLYRDDLFVRCDLKHRIGAGIEDRFSRRDMFISELFQDYGA